MAESPCPRSVLFYRDFMRYTGGHQKVFDYFNHIDQHPSFEARIAFSKRTVWDESNPWFPDYKSRQVPFEPLQYSMLFMAGRDWLILDEGVETARVVINLIQHVRHADPRHLLYRFLNRRALRIAVSPEVAQAIRDTGRVNGPVMTIDNGHGMPDLIRKKEYDFYVLGNKNPGLARELAKDLTEHSFRVVCSDQSIPRDRVMENMARAEISVVLPNPKEAEGFFLPALESMKYSNLTIVPDCVGNRSFCFHGKNCLMPEYDRQSLYQACHSGYALLQKPELADSIRQYSRRTVTRHTLEREREAFYRVLENLHEYGA